MLVVELFGTAGGRCSLAGDKSAEKSLRAEIRKSRLIGVQWPKRCVNDKIDIKKKSLEKKKPLSWPQVVHGLWFPFSPRELIWKGHGGRVARHSVGKMDQELPSQSPAWAVHGKLVVLRVLNSAEEDAFQAYMSI